MSQLLADFTSRLREKEDAILRGNVGGVVNPNAMPPLPIVPQQQHPTLSPYAMLLNHPPVHGGAPLPAASSRRIVDSLLVERGLPSNWGVHDVQADISTTSHSIPIFYQQQQTSQRRTSIPSPPVSSSPSSPSSPTTTNNANNAVTVNLHEALAQRDRAQEQIRGLLVTLSNSSAESTRLHAAVASAARDADRARAHAEAAEARASFAEAERYAAEAEFRTNNKSAVKASSSPSSSPALAAERVAMVAALEAATQAAAAAESRAVEAEARAAVAGDGLEALRAQRETSAIARDLAAARSALADAQSEASRARADAAAARNAQHTSETRALIARREASAGAEAILARDEAVSAIQSARAAAAREKAQSAAAVADAHAAMNQHATAAEAAALAVREARRESAMAIEAARKAAATEIAEAKAAFASATATLEERLSVANTEMAVHRETAAAARTSEGAMRVRLSSPLPRRAGARSSAAALYSRDAVSPVIPTSPASADMRAVLDYASRVEGALADARTHEGAVRMERVCGFIVARRLRPVLNTLRGGNGGGGNGRMFAASLVNNKSKVNHHTKVPNGLGPTPAGHNSMLEALAAASLEGESTGDDMRGGNGGGASSLSLSLGGTWGGRNTNIDSTSARTGGGGGGSAELDAARSAAARLRRALNDALARADMAADEAAAAECGAAAAHALLAQIAPPLVALLSELNVSSILSSVPTTSATSSSARGVPLLSLASPASRILSETSDPRNMPTPEAIGVAVSAARVLAQRAAALTDLLDGSGGTTTTTNNNNNNSNDGVVTPPGILIRAFDRLAVAVRTTCAPHVPPIVLARADALTKDAAAAFDASVARGRVREAAAARSASPTRARVLAGDLLKEAREAAAEAGRDAARAEAEATRAGARADVAEAEAAAATARAIAAESGTESMRENARRALGEARASLAAEGEALREDFDTARAEVAAVKHAAHVAATEASAAAGMALLESAATLAKCTKDAAAKLDAALAEVGRESAAKGVALATARTAELRLRDTMEAAAREIAEARASASKIAEERAARAAIAYASERERADAAQTRSDGLEAALHAVNGMLDDCAADLEAEKVLVSQQRADMAAAQTDAETARERERVALAALEEAEARAEDAREEARFANAAAQDAADELARLRRK